MKRSLFGLALASFFSTAVSVALAADLRMGSHERTYTSSDDFGCSCDAPGIMGMFCATPRACRELSGLCEGPCANSVSDEVGCSCDAPGIDSLVCATRPRCREMSGLCEGGC
jgi:hypothetical protein